MECVFVDCVFVECISLSVQLWNNVQAGKSGLQEALLVSLHLYGSKPLRDRTTGWERRGDALVQERLGRTDRQTDRQTDRVTDTEPDKKKADLIKSEQQRWKYFDF